MLDKLPPGVLGTVLFYLALPEGTPASREFLEKFRLVQMYLKDSPANKMPGHEGAYLSNTMLTYKTTVNHYNIKKLAADLVPLIEFKRLGGVELLKDYSGLFGGFSEHRIALSNMIDAFDYWIKLPVHEQQANYQLTLSLFNQIKNALLDPRTYIDNLFYGNVLFWAIHRDEVSLDIFKALIKAPWINVNMQNAYGQTALSICLSSEQSAKRWLDFLRNDEALANGLRTQINKCEQIVVELIKNHADVNIATTANPEASQSNKLSVTPLMIAARVGSAESVRALLGAGAKIESQALDKRDPNKRQTALDFARDENNTEIVQILEEHARKLGQQAVLHK